MGDAAAFAYVSMADAIADAGLSPEQVSNPRAGVIAGSGGGSCANQVEAADLLRAKGVRRVGPYMVTRTMCSTVSANLATAFSIRGLNYSIASACATSAHCIGAAMEQIQLGKQDLVFAGGGEELHWSQSVLFDAMGALSSKYNATPETRLARLRRRSRWFRHRRRRRHGRGRIARTRPGPRRAHPGRDRRLRRDLRWRRHGRPVRRRRGALHAPGAGHGRRSRSTTSTRTALPRRSATSPNSARCAMCSATTCRRSPRPSRCPGHSLGAAGVHEAIYCLIMMEHGFIAGSANIETLDPGRGRPAASSANRAMRNCAR